MEDTWRFVIVITIAVVLSETQASHFRGGTISWKSLGGRKVEFNFRLGWTYGSGPGCTPKKIGQFVSNLGGDNWSCTKGCSGQLKLSTANYICTGANQKEDWEQGKNTFTYTFQNDGTFEVSYSGSAWISLGGGKGSGSWFVSTTLTLGKRSDTGDVNNSPLSFSKPMYYTKFNCQIRLHIPVQDPDGDSVYCKWSNGNECASVCNALPGAYLDPKKCTITFDTTKGKGYVANEKYAVALTIEDHPKIPMTIGTAKKTPSDALSSIPIQFLITTLPPGKCDDKPQFVQPSPKENQVFTVEEGDKVTIDLYADNGKDTTVKVTSITPSGILGMTASSLTPVAHRKNTFKTTLTWQTGNTDFGNHLLCSGVTNANGLSGDDLCIKITVVHKGCGSNPCQNGAKCKSNKGHYVCACRPGFKGTNCEINIDDCPNPDPCKNGGNCTDSINTFICKCAKGFMGKTCQASIDDCPSPNPCKNGGKCVDGVNSYTCTCAIGFMGTHCTINIDDCKSKPCQHGGKCNDGVNAYTCTCAAGYTGQNCETNIDDCKPDPCKNGGNCTDGINAFTCDCVPGFTGQICATNIDDCTPNPCLNGGACVDGINKFICNCKPGFTGPRCGTNIDECKPRPCKNNGSCTDDINSFSCTCAPGFTGKTCSIDIDECQPKPCLKGGTCEDGINKYTCHCPWSFSGTNCEIKDHCIPDPCKNGALCVDLMKGYFCLCKPGYTGKTCQTDINECANNLCMNGAQCLDQVANFSCVCNPGYKGRLCQTGHDFCKPNPCSHGGKCNNGFSGSSCSCPIGWVGSTCSIRDLHPTKPPVTTTTITTTTATTSTTATLSKTSIGIPYSYSTIKVPNPGNGKVGITTSNKIFNPPLGGPPAHHPFGRTPTHHLLGGTPLPHQTAGTKNQNPPGGKSNHNPPKGTPNHNPPRGMPPKGTPNQHSVRGTPNHNPPRGSPNHHLWGAIPQKTPSTTSSGLIVTEVSASSECTLNGYECDCVLRPPRRAGMSRIVRDVLAFFFGFPLGLVLSALTYCLFRRCIPYCEKGQTYRQPRSRPEDSPRAISPDFSTPTISPAAPRDTNYFIFHN